MNASLTEPKLVSLAEARETHASLEFFTFDILTFGATGLVVIVH